MHIAEGILEFEPLLVGYLGAIGGTVVGLKEIDYEKIPQAGVLSAAFFVVSLIHVPVGFTSSHLILNGLLGIILGWGAFPAILVALILQAVFFTYGGLTTLGVNTLIMAAPAVVCSMLFRKLIGKLGTRSFIAAFLAGSLAVLLSATLLSIFLLSTGEAFWSMAIAILLANLPIVLIEGIITAFSVQFLLRVYPSLLSNTNALK